MKVWTHTGFKGHWPVPTAAVIVAETIEEAAEMLDRAIVGRVGPTAQGSAKLEDFRELDVAVPGVHILSDGNY